MADIKVGDTAKKAAEGGNNRNLAAYGEVEVFEVLFHLGRAADPPDHDLFPDVGIL